MLTNHSPAPWHYNEEVAYGRNIYDADGRWIGQAMGDHGRTNGAGFPSNDQCASNVTLMVAAPELLEALREIAKADGVFSLDPLTHAANCIANMQAIANAAIAKATGSVE